VNVANISLQSGGFALSGGGITVPATGNYMVTFRILTNSTGFTVGLYVNGVYKPDTAFGQGATMGQTTTQVIIPLDAGDLVTIRNLNTVNGSPAGSISTIVLATGGPAQVPYPVEIIFLKLD
jgi:hypothetical protein